MWLAEHHSPNLVHWLHLKCRLQATARHSVTHSNPTTSVPSECTVLPSKVRWYSQLKPSTPLFLYFKMPALPQTSLRKQKPSDHRSPPFSLQFINLLAHVPIFCAFSPATASLSAPTKSKPSSCILNSFSFSQEFCSFGSLTYLSSALVSPSLLAILISLFRNALLLPI